MLFLLNIGLSIFYLKKLNIECHVGHVKTEMFEVPYVIKWLNIYFRSFFSTNCANV